MSQYRIQEIPDLVVIQRVDTPPALALGSYQRLLAQDPQLVGHEGLFQTESLDDLTDP